MDRPVDLNHKLVHMAIEVRYEGPNRLLPTKLGAEQTSPAKSLPQRFLGLGRILAQSPRDYHHLFKQLFGNLLFDLDSHRQSAFPSPMGEGLGVRGQ